MALAVTAAPHWLSPTATRYLSAFSTPRGIVGLTLLTLLVLAAALAPVLFPGGYDVQGRESLTGMSGAHPFGQDEFGRDIFTRSIYGLRMDLSLILLAVPLSMTVGMLLGLSGAISERLGTAVMRLCDVIIGFPSLLLGICLVAVLGPGWFPLFLTIMRNHVRLLVILVGATAFTLELARQASSGRRGYRRLRRLDRPARLAVGPLPGRADPARRAVPAP